jgi:[acyl-carrier-protein] S-malonyltransferase
MVKCAFIFPGQGSQYRGMGKEFAAMSAGAREIFEEADDILGMGLSKIIFDGDEQQLRQTEITQPAILVTSMAALTVLREHGFFPDGTAGLSLGEYSALVCAGSLTFTDALPLVQKRAIYMQEAIPDGRGGMAAILGLGPQEVASLCREALPLGHVEPVNFNCPGQIVIAGYNEALEEACRLAKKKKAKAVMLSVSAPFHSRLLACIEEKMFSLLENISFRKPNIPFVANTSARYISEPQEIKASLVKQVFSPVLWESSIELFIRTGYNFFVEVGPGRALTGFMKKINKGVTSFYVQDRETLKKLLNHLEEVAL